MITIVDYGMGNLGSVLNIFKRIGVSAVVTGDLEVIAPFLQTPKLNDSAVME